MKNFSPEALSVLKKNGTLPVLCLKTPEQLETFEKALVNTPVNCVEIMLRHPFSIECISYIKKNYPSIIVGAGTVMTMDDYSRALDAGADFCVAPGFDETIVSKAMADGVFFLPGCITPTEIMHAQSMGCSIIKFFPAEGLGGTGTLKLYEGALAGISFIPTGGITLNNLADYLALDNVIACGGGYMVPKDMLAAGDSQGIADTINRCCSIRKAV